MTDYDNFMLICEVLDKIVTQLVRLYDRLGSIETILEDGLEVSRESASKEAKP